MSLDPKITELPAAPSISASTVVPGVESGVTYKVSMAQITTQVSTGLTLGTASTHDIGLGGATVPLLSNQNTFADFQIVNNGVKLRSSPSAGDPEAWIYSSVDGSASIKTNLNGSSQTFTFGADGTFSAPSGFTFPGGLAINQGGTGAITAAAARTNLGLGTASTQNTGSSGANVPLLNGTNTWSGVQTFTQAPVFTDASGSRTNLGLGTASTQSTGAFLQTANNLSDVTAATARTNLSVPSTARLVSTAGLATGGGDLSADRTITVTSATSSTVRTGTSTTTAMTPGDTYNALAEVTLTDAATIAVDMSTFLNARVTLSGNRTLGNPTNTKVGQSGYIAVVQDGAGSRTLSFASSWKRRGGAPTISTVAGTVDILIYVVVTSTYILYDVLNNPS